MKDLYTFDVDSTSASKSYHDVQNAYRRIFDSIGIPFTMAEADSGNIGGAKSHEYHFKSSSGEDTLIHCTVCPYTANLELAKSQISPSIDDINQTEVYFYTVPSTRTFLAVVLPIHHSIHPLKLSKVYPDARLVASVGEEERKFDQEWDQMEVLVDQSCTLLDVENIFDRITYRFRQTFTDVSDRNSAFEGQHADQSSKENKSTSLELSPLSIWPGLPTYSIHDIRAVSTSSGDNPESNKPVFQELCPDCSSPLESSTAIEVGHTFYLGTKYSSALDATFSIADPESGKQSSRAYEMGCFGIGISRLLGAIAECSQRDSGLRWPIKVAPFKVCIIIPPLNSKTNQDGKINTIAKRLASFLELNVPGLHGEVLIDDRDHKIGWKLNDANLVGYPLLIIIGNLWITNRLVQIKNQLLDHFHSLSVLHHPSHLPPTHLQSSPQNFDSFNFVPVKNHILLQLQGGSGKK